MKKVCSKCKIEKELMEFPKDKTKKDGLKSNCKACAKAYRKANKDKAKTYREVNRDKAKAYSKAYYETNKDKVKAYYKAYYEVNKDKIKAHSKIYFQTETGKEVLRKKNHKRRVRIKQVENLGTYTLQELEECRKFFNYCCAYSGEPLKDNEEVDHIVPISKGGTNNINNIVLATKEANNSKRANLIDEWYPKQPFYSKKRHNKIKEWIRIKSQINLFEL